MSPEPTLLLIDDDPSNLKSYAMAFVRSPYRVLTAAGGREGIEMLREESPDVVMTDLKMPEADGLEVVRAAAQMSNRPEVLVVTAFGTIETAVEAMRLGAYDFVTKPINIDGIREKIEKALEVHKLRVRNDELEELVNDRFKFEGVVGVSAAMHEVIEHSRMVARSKASVLVTGDSGTGKELIARAIHFNSPRASGPFVPIHCAAIPESLLEAELFGSEKGAYTGAVQRRIGHFESADGGTVFLDELGEIPTSMQIKLLRVLEQREITRVGASVPIAVDIRLVAATNKDLEAEMKIGNFREDLYYRLNVVRIHLPPLRERPEDIPPLVRHFLKEMAHEHRRTGLDISPEAVEALKHHDWPGNIRELHNVLEQMIVFNHDGQLDVDNLPTELQPLAGVAARSMGAGGSAALTREATQAELTLDELEKRYIIATLGEMDQNRTHAAKRLGISRRTLQRKLKYLGLEQE